MDLIHFASEGVICLDDELQPLREKKIKAKTNHTYFKILFSMAVELFSLILRNFRCHI